MYCQFFFCFEIINGENRLIKMLKSRPRIELHSLHFFQACLVNNNSGHFLILFVILQVRYFLYYLSNVVKTFKISFTELSANISKITKVKNYSFKNIEKKYENNYGCESKGCEIIVIILIRIQ